MQNQLNSQLREHFLHLDNNPTVFTSTPQYIIDAEHRTLLFSIQRITDRLRSDPNSPIHHIAQLTPFQLSSIATELTTEVQAVWKDMMADQMHDEDTTLDTADIKDLSPSPLCEQLREYFLQIDNSPVIFLKTKQEVIAAQHRMLLLTLKAIARRLERGDGVQGGVPVRDIVILKREEGSLDKIGEELKEVVNNVWREWWEREGKFGHY